jgi:hypothetical protein
MISVRTIPLKKAFAVEEQPDDGTRYTHIIAVDNHEVYVTRDLVRAGAGCTVGFSILELKGYIADGFMDMSVREQTKFAREIDDTYNPWTLASAVRCAIRVLEDIC